jgi:hypothetical protein
MLQSFRRFAAILALASGATLLDAPMTPSEAQAGLQQTRAKKAKPAAPARVERRPRRSGELPPPARPAYDSPGRNPEGGSGGGGGY